MPCWRTLRPWLLQLMALSTCLKGLMPASLQIRSGVLRGTQPGAWAEIVVDTCSKTYQGDALVWLSHLKSYRGMGVALVECKEGCTCQPAKLDGKYDRHVSVFWMLKFFVSQHERCRLQVTITDEPAGQQGEHKVTLAAVMVTHFENMGVAGTLASVKGIHDGVNMG